MIVELLLQNDFFYDEGELSTNEMEWLHRRIMDEDVGVSEVEVPLVVLELLPVQRYKGKYYHCYRSLPQYLKQTYGDLCSMRRDELTQDDVVYTQADLFKALGLSMSKENIINNMPL